ncbi:MAG: FKBP-type peptidyl-prolyl cis-trans isomerase [Prevotella sp.]|nr:FKBP-type peptidyl-prolyl cis-trans isomerase [Prevotella sp.]MCR5068921.1 FKBP-type peptidyl-prolyl cis-trans isomerase [Prevotella sp.]
MANKYYAVSYKLFSIKDGERVMQEETDANDPFVFISGFGTTIPSFEKQIENLAKGDSFDFTIPQTEAYGEYVAERVIELDKQIFHINGKFDESQIYVGAIIPLQNEDGNRFMGNVLEITDSKVKVDLNHPLAGCDLQFQGTITECRDATDEEIVQMINRLSGGGCGGCGGGGCHSNGECSGGCNSGEGGCGGCGGGCH